MRAGDALKVREFGKGVACGGLPALGRAFGADKGRGEDQFDVAPGAEDQVGLAHQRVNGRGRVAAPGLPELGPEIAVVRHLQAQAARDLHGFQSGFRAVGAERGGNARHMKPGSAFQQACPGCSRKRRRGEGGARAVIEDVGRALDGAGRQEIEPHAPGRGLDARDIDAPAAQLLQGGEAEVVVGHDGDHLRRLAEALQA